MTGIGNIKVDAKGKSKEEIKKEIMAQMEEQIEQMFAAKEAEEKQKEEEKVYIHVTADVVEDKKGYNVAVEYNGDFYEVISMFTVAVAEALHNMADDAEGEHSPGLLLDFIHALIGEYKNNELSGNKGKVVKEEEK